MKRLTSLAAAACALSITASALPALAQYASEFVPPKVKSQGKSMHSVAGKGDVEIQVEVKANGSHKVVKVIKSTNHGDDAAAMDIANSSTYIPAHRGKTRITAFYDFALSFNGAMVTHGDQAGSSSDNGIDAMIRAGKYDDAIAAANAQLARDPSDAMTTQQLAVAEYYKAAGSKNADFTPAANAFSKVPDVSRAYAPVAAQAYQGAAMQLVHSDPVQALDYAKRADAISSSLNSKYLIGVTEFENKQYAPAIAALKSIHEDSHLNAKTKVAIDDQLLQAYLATNDLADADAMNKEIHGLDPTSTLGAHEMGIHYLQTGINAMQAKDYATAVKNFDQAAAEGNPQDAVTANTYSAFAYLSMSTPDYDKARDYGLKAVAGAPDNPQANYALGEAYAGTYVKSQRADDKKKAIDYLTNAQKYAQAAGNADLAQKAAAQIKTISGSNQ